MLLIFTTPVLIRHLWQLKKVVILHWCLIHAVLLHLLYIFSIVELSCKYNLSFDNNANVRSTCPLYSITDHLILQTQAY